MSTAPSIPSFERIQQSRIFEEIASQIRRQLATGVLKQGDKLPAERELAAQLGVGRNAVREALRALEIAGILRLRKGGTGGAFIAQPTGDVLVSAIGDMYDLGGITPAQITEARLGITDTIVRLACARCSEAQLDELAANIEAAERAHKRGDFVARARISNEFHQILSCAAGNPLLAAMMAGLLQVMYRFIDVYGAPDDNYVVRSRKIFMRHMRNRDTEAASKEMAKLLQKVHAFYLVRSGRTAQDPLPPAQPAKEEGSMATGKAEAAITARKP
ncbi:MAG: FadR/GntR family transcriptional regulator [Burkholderiaceae bacterium]